eukprot:jgi/Picre1/32725/NNA_008070.t1
MEGRGGDLSQERFGKVEEDTVGNHLKEEMRALFARRKRRVLAAAAGGFGGAVYRTAAAAGTMLSDRALRQKGAEVISSNAAKGMKGIQQGLSTGAYGIRGV